MINGAVKIARQKYCSRSERSRKISSATMNDGTMASGTPTSVQIATLIADWRKSASAKTCGEVLQTRPTPGGLKPSHRVNEV